MTAVHQNGGWQTVSSVVISKTCIKKVHCSYKRLPYRHIWGDLENDASGYWKGGSSCFRSKKIEFVFTGLSFTGSGRWTGGGLFLLSGWMALKHEGSWGRTRWRIRVQVQAGLFCHDQLVLSLPINHCFPFTHLPGSTPVDISGYRGDWGLIRKTQVFLWGKSFFTCGEACFDALLEARSFFIRGLVERGGWTGSSWSDVREWLHSSCSRVGAAIDEFVRRLSSGICNQKLQKQTCHCRVIVYESVGWRRCSATIMTHLCIVELLLKDLNIEAVLPPGVQHQRLAHLSCRPIDLKSKLHLDLPFKWWRSLKTFDLKIALTLCFHSL